MPGRDMSDLHLDCYNCWEGCCVIHPSVYVAVHALAKDYEALGEQIKELEAENAGLKYLLKESQAEAQYLATSLLLGNDPATERSTDGDVSEDPRPVP